MKDDECVRFLQWALPRLGKRWPGFRKVRRQVCKRIDCRLLDLGVDNLVQYRRYLQANQAEWDNLDQLCRVTISRFYRDQRVFDRLGNTVLPELAQAALGRGEKTLRCWSVGCGSGEEPYTLALIWHRVLQRMYPGLTCEIIATDLDETVLQRAHDGCYPASSLKELPAGLVADFEKRGQFYFLPQHIRDLVTPMVQDIRNESPAGCFHLILCRNLVFTYFDQVRQQDVLTRLSDALYGGGALVLGGHEELPGEPIHFDRWFPHLPIYRKRKGPLCSTVR
jgi:chemotaxis protein methyltransferase CheR